jgi:hypothetical protein
VKSLEIGEERRESESGFIHGTSSTADREGSQSVKVGIVDAFYRRGEERRVVERREVEKEVSYRGTSGDESKKR